MLRGVLQLSHFNEDREEVFPLFKIHLGVPVAMFFAVPWSLTAQNAGKTRGKHYIKYWAPKKGDASCMPHLVLQPLHGTMPNSALPCLKRISWA